MSYKIYFAGSIRGGREDAHLYFRIVEVLKSYGTVLTEHVADQGVLDSETEKSDKFIHDRDLEWLKECDAVVAEVTQPSLGVGYEIGRAIAFNKTVLCLFRPDSGKTLSAMIGGAINDTNFFVKHYQESEVADILKDFFAKLKLPA